MRLYIKKPEKLEMIQCSKAQRKTEMLLVINGRSMWADLSESDPIDPKGALSLDMSRSCLNPEDVLFQQLLMRFFASSLLLQLNEYSVLG